MGEFLKYRSTSCNRQWPMANGVNITITITLRHVPFQRKKGNIRHCLCGNPHACDSGFVHAADDK